jgi:hypothetical protein
MFAGLFSFPDPVNEVASRILAGCVFALCLAALLTKQPWLIAAISYGFVARVLTGPSLSPLGQLVTRVLTPLSGLQAAYCPGPPKRFAQSIGAVISASACWAAFNQYWLATSMLLLVLALFAFLEAAFGWCAGCRVFSLLIRAGLVPDDVCQRCNNISKEAPVA